MRYHICVDTVKHRWEIRNEKEKIILYGDPETIKEKFEKNYK